MHYLSSQSVPRGEFEVVLIEFYDRIPEAAKEFESVIDSWTLLEMPNRCYYHKHLMYNAGIVLSRGDLIMFMDSDAMVRPTFIQTVVNAFDSATRMVYHMDQFRNVSRTFYPFNYPSFEQVTGDECINYADGRTTGIADDPDPELPVADQVAEMMHSRNSGAAMCARREDLLAIGGADEDISYLGHICGPYEMSFRLMNSGCRLVWETREYLYHTWHPGSDGVDNYFGPHDGRNFSTTALDALHSGRVEPLIENKAIHALRSGLRRDSSDLKSALVDPLYLSAFDRSTLVSAPATVQHRQHTLSGFETRLVESIGKCNICQVGKRFAVVPQSVGAVDFRIRAQRENPGILWSATLVEARRIATRIQ